MQIEDNSKWPRSLWGNDHQINASTEMVAPFKHHFGLCSGEAWQTQRQDDSPLQQQEIQILDS